MVQSLNLLEFQLKFATEADCLRAIERARWPNGFLCSGCGHDDGYRLSNRHVIQCSCCRRQTSITAGTIFHKTRVPLMKWFYIAFLMAQDKGGIAALQVTRLLNMRYDTVWHIMHKIRLSMRKRDEHILVSGFVEIDEGYFGGKSKGRGNRGHGSAKKVPVLVMIESMGVKAGKIVMKRIGYPDMEQIRSVVQPHSKGRQTFRSDGWGPYGIISSLGHKLILSPIPKDQLNSEHKWVHRAISLAKRFLLGTYHGLGGKYLQNYLDEFCYRFNRRRHPSLIFERLLIAIARVSPITYAAISG